MSKRKDVDTVELQRVQSQFENWRSIIALLKYGNGFPFYRLDNFQESLGVPICRPPRNLG